MKTYRIIKVYADGTDGPVVGHAKEFSRGWRFISHNSAHGSSRKFHKTFDKVIPRWAGGLNGTRSELITN